MTDWCVWTWYQVHPGTMWWLILMTTFWCPEKIRWSDVFFCIWIWRCRPIRPLPAKLGSSQAAIYVEETVEAGRVWWCLARRHSFPPISCLRHKPLALQRLPLRCGKIRQLVGWYEEYSWCWYILMIVVLFAVDIVYFVYIVIVVCVCWFACYVWPHARR